MKSNNLSYLKQRRLNQMKILPERLKRLTPDQLKLELEREELERSMEYEIDEPRDPEDGTTLLEDLFYEEMETFRKTGKKPREKKLKNGRTITSVPKSLTEF
jgi:hypothetical protein